MEFTTLPDISSFRLFLEHIADLIHHLAMK